MGFFDKIKEYKRMVSQVERNIYGGKQELLEVYERNLQLQKEIEIRTTELNEANKRMLTLQHIWDMMNSSTPLENVLEKVVTSIHGELGYLHCAIIRKLHDENGDYMQIVTQSKDSAIARVNNIIGTPIEMRRLTYDPDSIYADTIKNKKIIQTKDLGGTLKYIMPDLPDDVAKAAVTNQPCKSLIIIPLCPMNKEFGWFCVFTSRDELAESETDFLSLYAQQIEMSITITDLFLAVKEQAVTDSLTGLYNRRHFEENLKREVTRAQRQHQPFSIIGIDLDHLKRINDEYGHAYGDLAIKTIADELKNNARSVDLPARMGGEEFNVLLPGIDSTGAMVAAERIRKAIESKELDVIGHVTASIGVATYFEHTENIEELLELTDQAMYTSKRNGRNQVTLAKPVTETSWQEIAVNTFLEILSKRKVPIPQEVVKDLEEKLQNPAEMSKDNLFAVADILTSTYNPMHNSGVMKSKVLLATSLAKRFDLSKAEIDNLRIAILLYDIGNLMLPAELLMKATPLTEEEKQHIKEHPMIAAREILKPISYIKDVIPIIEHHHENWDGSGYPKKLSHEEIPLTSQIVLIVDAYFALIEHRPYRAKHTPQDALEIIKQDAGKKWNKALVQEFATLTELDIV